MKGPFFVVSTLWIVLNQIGHSVLDEHRSSVVNPVAGVEVTRFVSFDDSVKGLMSMAKNEHVHIGTVMGLAPSLGELVKMLLAHRTQRPFALLSALSRPGLREGDAEIGMDAFECSLAQLGGEHALQPSIS